MMISNNSVKLRYKRIVESEFEFSEETDLNAVDSEEYCLTRLVKYEDLIDLGLENIELANVGESIAAQSNNTENNMQYHKEEEKSGEIPGLNIYGSEEDDEAEYAELLCFLKAHRLRRVNLELDQENMLNKCYKPYWNEGEASSIPAAISGEDGEEFPACLRGFTDNFNSKLLRIVLKTAPSRPLYHNRHAMSYASFIKANPRKLARHVFLLVVDGSQQSKMAFVKAKLLKLVLQTILDLPASASKIIYLNTNPENIIDWIFCRLRLIGDGDTLVCLSSLNEALLLIKKLNGCGISEKQAVAANVLIFGGNALTRVVGIEGSKPVNWVVSYGAVDILALGKHFVFGQVIDSGTVAQTRNGVSRRVLASKEEAYLRSRFATTVYRMYTKTTHRKQMKQIESVIPGSLQQQFLLHLYYYHKVYQNRFIPIHNESLLLLLQLKLILLAHHPVKDDFVDNCKRARLGNRGECQYEITQLGEIVCGMSVHDLECAAYLARASEDGCLLQAGKFIQSCRYYDGCRRKAAQWVRIWANTRQNHNMLGDSLAWKKSLVATLCHRVAQREGAVYRLLATGEALHAWNDSPEFIVVLQHGRGKVRHFVEIESEILRGSCSDAFFIESKFLDASATRILNSVEGAVSREHEECEITPDPHKNTHGKPSAQSPSCENRPPWGERLEEESEEKVRQLLGRLKGRIDLDALFDMVTDHEDECFGPL